MNKEQMRERLINDYEQYLSDFNISELREILKSGTFTLREARRLSEENDGMPDAGINR